MAIRAWASGCWAAPRAPSWRRRTRPTCSWRTEDGAPRMADLEPRFGRLARLFDRGPNARPLPAAIVHPCDAVSLRAAAQCAAMGLIEPILTGPPARIAAEARAAETDITGFAIEPAAHSHAAARRAVELVRAGRAAMIVKGALHTDELMEAVVDPAGGLRTERRISHVFLIDAATYPRLLFVTDAAINIAPSLEDKRDIVQNAIDLAAAVGVQTPRVALLSAVETVTSRLPSTVEAAALCKMADRGQIVGALLDGPLALDNAVNPAAAADKGLVSSVAGRADILVAPNLEAGNILAKQLTFLEGAQAAGVVLGARVPIALGSRADSLESHIAACAAAVLMAERGAAPLKPRGA
ncbi:MAG: bifunctional enoyl-CoA hydratase/phosphate acetyltransferase [Proteobacteria bacterium]|nr:bifunctional enoyl-CoA hydratase/phosphate acetyltransferase [Pseudomonadota bacterium]